VLELRISTGDEVSLDFFEDNSAVPLPELVQGWAALYEGLGLRLRADRVVMSKSRFLREIHRVRSFRDELDVSVSIDTATGALLDGYRIEQKDFEAALKGQKRGGAISWSAAIGALKEAGFKRLESLKQHQLEAIELLIGLRNGANFSVPGAGKTTVTLAVHEIEKLRSPNLRLLIVAPRNAMGAWDIEIRACLESPPEIIRLSGGALGVRKQLKQAPQAAIISYELLRTTFEEVMRFLDSTPVHLVLDESHRVKSGYESSQGAAVLELAPSAYRRDILSGTPMPQRLRDICSQLSFLWPYRTFCGSIIQESAPDALESTNRVIAPLFTRTTKAQLQLPPIERVSSPVLEMAPFQGRAYRLIRAEASRQFRINDLASSDRARALGAQVVTLLQIASNPRLAFDRLAFDTVSADFPEFSDALKNAAQSETSNKFQMLDELVQDLMGTPDEKVVIWSSFVGTITEIESKYSDFGAMSIHGAVKTGSDENIEFREARVKRFNEDPRHRILVVNPAAGGEGISLHKAAHNAIYFDRNFNAAHYLQSVDRIHRLGLPPDIVTRIFVLESADSIDEVLAVRLSTKIRAMETVLNDFGIEPLALDVEDFPSTDDEAGLDEADIKAIAAHLAS